MSAPPPDTAAPAAGPRPELVLASASPRRAHLLRGLGLRFRVEPAAVDEADQEFGSPVELTLHNAALKAAWAAARFPAWPVLAADTTVCLGGRIFNKPADLAGAREMLRALAGRTHEVHTAVDLRWAAGGVREAVVGRSEVTFKPLTEAAIERYFALVNPLDKAGAYGVQEGTEIILERLEGSFANVMGLPVELLEERLRALGWWELLRGDEV